MKTFFAVLALSLFLPTYAQEFSGRATYQKKEVLIIKNPKPEHNTPEFQQRLEAMNKSMEKTHLLEFTKDESVYTEEAKLPTAFKQADGRTASTSMREVWSKIYKNLKKDYILIDMDGVVVKDSLQASGWQLSTESKQIGNYTVYKATKTIKAKKADNEEKSTNFLSMVDKEPEDRVYTAWYTPEIPIPNGPDKFGGLPGLILELHIDNIVYLCSEIVLNPQKPIEIKIPKGKVISKEEYDKMVKQRFEVYKRQKNQGTIIKRGE